MDNKRKFRRYLSLNPKMSNRKSPITRLNTLLEDYTNLNEREIKKALNKRNYILWFVKTSCINVPLATVWIPNKNSEGVYLPIRSKPSLYEICNEAFRKIGDSISIQNSSTSLYNEKDKVYESLIKKLEPLKLTHEESRDIRDSVYKHFSKVRFCSIKVFLEKDLIEYKHIIVALQRLGVFISYDENNNELYLLSKYESEKNLSDLVEYIFKLDYKVLRVFGTKEGLVPLRGNRKRMKAIVRDENNKCKELATVVNIWNTKKVKHTKKDIEWRNNVLLPEVINDTKKAITKVNKQIEIKLNWYKRIKYNVDQKYMKSPGILKYANVPLLYSRYFEGVDGLEMKSFINFVICKGFDEPVRIYEICKKLNFELTNVENYLLELQNNDDIKRLPYKYNDVISGIAKRVENYYSGAEIKRSYYKNVSKIYKSRLLVYLVNSLLTLLSISNFTKTIMEATLLYILNLLKNMELNISDECSYLFFQKIHDNI